MKSEKMNKRPCNLRLVVMALVCGVILQVASAAAAGPGEAAGVEPVSLNGAIEVIDLRRGCFIVAEEEIILEKAGSLARLMGINGTTVRLESFKTGEWVQVTGARFPDGKTYAFEIRKVRR